MSAESAIESSDLLETLKHAFGYDAFRPQQEEIIRAWLGNRDAFALLPTGGGKSLCFQLPALLRPGLTLVVSPLIALMKDQVDQLQTAGIPATYLNSSLSERETRERLSGLHRGEYRLLYAAPERILMDHWRENLVNWNVSGIAIDEAHCISEWGHDFRPEYRKLATLRNLLPEIAVMALTATATERVRQDIVRHLQLRDPAIFVGSFNRPNLTYRVLPKDRPLGQVIEFIRTRKEESGIIYCATRATTERLAEALCAKNINAIPYHAGLPPEERSRNQERFLRDDARVVCATIAFGMGINKPNVRWVIHHDLPKNLEGYYQETGRAGRDGLPSDCLLLYSPGDKAKQLHFIEEISSERERDMARSQLRTMTAYAESANCRRTVLLEYFGEHYPEQNCKSCDNCLEPRETFDATIPAQKFLSCVVRISQVTNFAVGLNHIVEVLTGANTDKIRRWHHDQISTYGIGNDLPRADWISIGRQLLERGYLQQTTPERPTVSLTPKGLELLKTRAPIKLSKPLTIPKAARSRPSQPGAIECDEALFSRLRSLRKRLADERGVPAYVIFGDNTLRQMARHYPVGLRDMASISGIGDKKLDQFGQLFTAEIEAYLKDYPKIRFQD